jgi:hypothetical protein
MQDKHLFEYAVIRLVPRVEREEFINVGIILYCRAEQFLQTKFLLDIKKLSAFAGQPDVKEIEENLLSFCRICKGGAEAGPIGSLGLAERFRWLTAMRSTMVQTSRAHPGFCDNAAEMLERLYEQMVL